jgi:hypothetical protein
MDEKTLLLVISQSGETADTIAASREAKELGSRVLAICNVQGSMIVREADGTILTHAGPEIGVASTKASDSQKSPTFGGQFRDRSVKMSRNPRPYTRRITFPYLVCRRRYWRTRVTCWHGWSDNSCLSCLLCASVPSVPLCFPSKLDFVQRSLVKQ